MCSTSWTVRPACRSVIDMLKVLHELCVVCLEAKLDPDIRQHIIGVKYQMEMFNYFYGVNFGLFLKHSHHLSRTIQHSHMSVAECKLVVA